VQAHTHTVQPAHLAIGSVFNDFFFLSVASVSSLSLFSILYLLRVLLWPMSMYTALHASLRLRRAWIRIANVCDICAVRCRGAVRRLGDGDGW
jgi:hypothetical protein